MNTAAEVRTQRKETVQKRFWQDPDKKYFLGMLAFGAFVYFPMFSQNLVNTFDGLWNSFYNKGGMWELSIGRWFWLFFDWIRFGIQTNPINALLTLSMIALGMTLIRRLFVQNGTALAYLAGGGFLSGAVIGTWLSYQFMAPIFGLSFLLAAAAAERAADMDDMGKAIGTGAVLLALSLGLYQANLACFCMVLLAFLLKLVFQNAEREKVHAHILKSLGSAAAGMVLYWVVLKLFQGMWGVKMAHYKGADQISVLNIIKSIPRGIPKTFRLFADYFIRDVYHSNVMQKNGLLVAVLAVIAAVLVFCLARLARSKNWEYLLLGIAALAALPVACNVMLLITSEAAWRMQMSAGLALFVPLLLLVLAAVRPAQQSRGGGTVQIVVLALAVLVVYGNVYMMAVDQEAMRQGTASVRVMADRIVDDLTDVGYFEAENTENEVTVLMVGRPSSNPTFKKGALYLMANRYAQMGRFWLSADCTTYSWRGVFEKITPADITLCSEEQYKELIETETVKEMPLYPQKGYIRKVGNVLIVKVSEDYLVMED